MALPAMAGGRPSGDRDAALVTALAEKLGIDEATVTKALAEVRAEQQAGRPDAAGTATPAAPEPSASPSA